MKQIFKYILISTAIMLSISSCREEMEAPREGEDIVITNRLASADQQVTAAKTTLEALTKYSSALSDGFLPELREIVGSAGTKADSKGDVTAAMKNILTDLEKAEENINEGIAELNGYLETYNHQTSLPVITQASIELHGVLSEILAEVPSHVDAIISFLEILNAADTESVQTSLDKVQKAHNDLLNKDLAPVRKALNDLIGEGILPDNCASGRISGHVHLVKEEMEARKIVFRSHLESVVDCLSNPKNQTLSNQEFTSLVLNAAEKKDGKLNSSTSDKIKESHIALKSQVSAVESSMQLFSDEVIEVVELLAPIQSVSFMSPTSEDVAYAKYSGFGRENIELDFTIRPAEIAQILVADYQTYISVVAYNPSESIEAGSPATGLSQAPQIKSATLNGDILTVTLDPTNVPAGVYNGTAPYSIALNVSNGVQELATDFIRLKRKSVPGLQINPYENIPVIKGEVKSIPFSYTADSDVTVTVEGNNFIGAASLSSLYKDFKTGYISVTISEANSIEMQSATVTLTAGSESVSRVLTFTEAGSFNITVPRMIPASGGEITLSVSGTITGNTQTEVVAGAAWLSKVNGVANTFLAEVNTGTNPRTATVKYTINGHSKHATITQMGTNPSASSYEMFLGSWDMTANEAISGATGQTRSLTFMKDLGVEGGYLVTGLANGSGMYPVRMRYNYGSGNIEFTVPQTGLDGDRLGVYHTTLDENTPVGSNTSKTYTFTWDGSSLTGNMTSSESFMYMDNEFNVNNTDKTFYYNISLKRAEATYLTSGSSYQLWQATNTDIQYPVNIIILGDGYQKVSLQDGGLFQRNAESAMGTIFAFEPYSTFKDRFNVYMIPYESADEGTTIVGSDITKNTRYSSRCYDNGNTLIQANYNRVFEDIAAAGFSEDQVYKSLVLLLINSNTSSGTCWQEQGSVTTDASKSGDGFLSRHVAMIAAHNTMTNGLIIHEAGGHGFGRLGDEYTSNAGNTFTAENAASLENTWHQYGFYWNVTPYKNDSRSRWEVFATRPEYQNAGVGYFESAYNYQYGIYRSENSSIMLNNNGRFNVISRFVLFRRIMMTTQPSVYTNDNIHNAFIEYDKKNIAVESISLNKTSEKLNKGGTLQLNATLNIKGGSSVTNKSVVWSSSDENVATVSSTGLVTAVGSGSATITVHTDDNVYDDRKSNTCSITVSAPVTGVTITPSSYTFSELNATTELTLNITGEYTNISWSSSNTSVVTSMVNIYDKTKTTITSKGNGSATITATVTSSDGSTHTATCSVNVSSERTTPAVGDYVYSNGSWSDGTKAATGTPIGLVCYLGDLSSDTLLDDSYNAIVVGLSDITSSIYNGKTNTDFWNSVKGSTTSNNKTTSPTDKLYGYTLSNAWIKCITWGAVKDHLILSDAAAITGSSAWYVPAIGEYKQIKAMQSKAGLTKSGYTDISGDYATLYLNSSSGYIYKYSTSSNAVNGTGSATNSHNIRKVFAMTITDK